MAGSAARLAFGSGREIFLADAGPSPVVRSRLVLETEATGGALLRDRLFLVLDGTRLASLDLGDPDAAVQLVTRVPLSPASRLQVTVMGNLLLVAEEHRGVHIIKFRAMHPMPAHAAHGPAGPALLGRFPVAGRITALAAVGGVLWIATRSGEELLQVDVRVPSRPMLERRWYLDAPIVALSGDGTRLHALTDDGLRVLAGDADGTWQVMAGDPGVTGAALVSSGRSLLVASVGGGVQSYREAAPEAATFTVHVLDDFFTPEALTVRVGDRVNWVNAAGIHNVLSCTVGESGCTATANEMFLSGIPQPGLWSYSYTFTATGDNPYVCQSHAPFMTGEVTVLPALAGPPPVPDGTFGTPMTVQSSDPAVLILDWDVYTCTPQDQHQILYGGGSQLPTLPGGTFGLLGSRCGLGSTGKTEWTDAPHPSVDSSGLLWWLLVAYDGSVEGSWGRGSDGVERNSPFPGGVSGQCGNFTKDLGNTCP
jgi:plastocyanin